MWLRPAWREGGWWDSVCVSVSVRNSPQREAHPGYILAVGMTTTLYWGHWGMGFPRDPGLAVQGCCCPWQCLVPPGSIFPTTQRGHGLVSCSGIQEPIRDTTACGRKALAVPVPARAALRVRNVPVPLGCTFPVLFSSNSLTPNPKREQPEPCRLTSDSRIPAGSRGRCGRCPAGRSAGSRIPRGARSPGLMLEPGAALQGTERGGGFEPRCRAQPLVPARPELAQPLLVPCLNSRNPGEFMALEWETVTTPLSRLWERSPSCLLPPFWSKGELQGWKQDFPSSPLLLLLLSCRAAVPGAADSGMQRSGGMERSQIPVLEG